MGIGMSRFLLVPLAWMKNEKAAFGFKGCFAALFSEKLVPSTGILATHSRIDSKTPK